MLRSDPIAELLAPYQSALSGTPKAGMVGTTQQTDLTGDLLGIMLGGVGQGGGGGGFGGAPGDLVQLGRKLQRKGFDVGENSAFGGVAPVHTDNSWHYKDRALDINYNGGGRWANEQQALGWLERWLARKYDPLELIFGGNSFNPTSNDSTHLSHLHFAM